MTARRHLFVFAASAVVIGFPLSAFAEEAADKLACLQRSLEIVDVQYRVEGAGFPKVQMKVRNGLDWPVKGFKVDYVVTDATPSNVMLEHTSVGTTDDPVLPGQTRDFSLISVYVGSLGNDADVARETIKSWTTTARMRDVLDGDDRQLLKDGSVTMTGWSNPLSERTCT